MNKALMLSLAAFSAVSQFSVTGINLVTAQTPYTMVCRGTGNMKSYYSQKSNFNQLDIYFSKATKGSGQSSLKAGNCAWVDRGISNNEPSKLRWEPKQFDDSTISLLKSVRSDKLFYIRTYNVEGSYFKIVKLGF
ncbi:MAG: hypothetical protein AAF630_15045 [Cyanobacteria bacterium P01_C01_bin.38]